MDQISQIIPGVIEQILLKKPCGQDKWQRVWISLLDDKEKKHSCLTEFMNGNLVIDVDSSAWLFQMNLKKNFFLKKIRDEIPDIKDIVFKIGKVK